MCIGIMEEECEKNGKKHLKLLEKFNERCEKPVCCKLCNITGRNGRNSKLVERYTMSMN